MSNQLVLEFMEHTGRSFTKFIELDPGIADLEPGEKTAARKQEVIKLANLLNTKNPMDYMTSLLSSICDTETPGFTGDKILLEKIENLKSSPNDESLLKELSEMGHALLDFSYGFDDDDQKNRFVGFFGEQDDEQSINPAISRGLGIAALMLLPEDLQAPGLDDYKNLFDEGPVEAMICILATCLGAIHFAKINNKPVRGGASSGTPLFISLDLLFK